MTQNSFLSTINSNELSAEEFQRKLYNWFEDRGLLSDVRTHLRRQMIQALRDTSLNVPSAGNFRHAGSPKLQAINMLVAEFLLQQEYHYTLSVFTSEVPLLRNVPEFIKSVNSAIKGKQTVNTPAEGHPCFPFHDVCDILEALGISPNSKEGKKAYELYANTPGQPLLNCIIRCTPEVFQISASNEQVSTASNESVSVTNLLAENTRRNKLDSAGMNEILRVNIKSMLSQFPLSPQVIKDIDDQFRRILENEVALIRKEEEKKFQNELLRREHRIQNQLIQHEEEVNKKLTEAAEHLENQRQSMDLNLTTKQKHLEELAYQLQQQQREIEQQVMHVKEQSEQLKRKENELKMKHEEVEKKSSQMNFLENELSRLSTELDEKTIIQAELEDNCQKLHQASITLRESQAEVAFLRDLHQHYFRILDKQQLHCQSYRAEVVQKESNIQKLDEMKHIKYDTQRPYESNETHQEEDKMTCATEAKYKNEATNTHPQEREQKSETASLDTSQYMKYNDLIQQLQQENAELREHVQQQRLRINELTNHAAQLAHKMENTRIALSQEEAHNQTRNCEAFSKSLPAIPANHGVPPKIHVLQGSLLVPPPRPALSKLDCYPYINSPLKQAWAGETYNALSSEVQHPANQRTVVQSQRNRKIPKRLTIHNTSSDESSSTDEVLQEAKLRLRKLEEESEAVDRKYQEFKFRQSKNLPPNFGLLQPGFSLLLGRHEETAQLPPSTLNNSQHFALSSESYCYEIHPLSETSSIPNPEISNTSPAVPSLSNFQEQQPKYNSSNHSYPPSYPPLAENVINYSTISPWIGGLDMHNYSNVTKNYLFPQKSQDQAQLDSSVQEISENNLERLSSACIFSDARSTFIDSSQAVDISVDKNITAMPPKVVHHDAPLCTSVYSTQLISSVKESFKINDTSEHLKDSSESNVLIPLSLIREMMDISVPTTEQQPISSLPKTNIVMSDVPQKQSLHATDTSQILNRCMIRGDDSEIILDSLAIPFQQQDIPENIIPKNLLTSTSADLYLDDFSTKEMSHCVDLCVDDITCKIMNGQSPQFVDIYLEDVFYQPKFQPAATVQPEGAINAESISLSLSRSFNAHYNDQPLPSKSVTAFAQNTQSPTIAIMDTKCNDAVDNSHTNQKVTETTVHEPKEDDDSIQKIAENNLRQNRFIYARNNESVTTYAEGTWGTISTHAVDYSQVNRKGSESTVHESKKDDDSIQKIAENNLRENRFLYARNDESVTTYAEGIWGTISTQAVDYSQVNQKGSESAVHEPEKDDDSIQKIAENNLRENRFIYARNDESVTTYAEGIWGTISTQAVDYSQVNQKGSESTDHESKKDDDSIRKIPEDSLEQDGRNNANETTHAERVSSSVTTNSKSTDAANNSQMSQKEIKTTTFHEQKKEDGVIQKSVEDFQQTKLLYISNTESEVTYAGSISPAVSTDVKCTDIGGNVQINQKGSDRMVQEPKKQGDVIQNTADNGLQESIYIYVRGNKTSLTDEKEVNDASTVVVANKNSLSEDSSEQISVGEESNTADDDFW